ncbi:MAG: MBL fold metallo-hydrolase [Acidobacteria bacterium]|nr:MAG: MBL fold metallo-hydrolase [Acidobacteriota bacterium]REK06157.1 MAG: MBL fold metallo-hydrolase [Acidobacteriota bacterium]
MKLARPPKARLAHTALLVVASALCDSEAQAQQPGMRVHFFDVGQGDATLIELPKGSILVDTGGEDGGSYDFRPGLNRELDAFFDRRTDLGGRLDLLVITHPHPDHYQGMKPAPWWNSSLRPVLDTYRPRNVVHNGDRPVAKWVDNYANNEAGVAVEEITLGKLPANGPLTSTVIDPFPYDGDFDPEVRVLWGRPTNETGWCDADFEEENNHSIVLRVDYGGASILFTGDLEISDSFECNPDDQAGIERVLARYRNATPNLLEVDVYQVGHHGSHNATNEALVRAMNPKIAVMSHGPAYWRGKYSAHSHAHPRLATVQHLEAPTYGVDLCRSKKSVKLYRRHKTQPIDHEIRRAVFSTAWDGPVVLFGGGNGFWTVEQPTGAELGTC